MVCAHYLNLKIRNARVERKKRKELDDKLKKAKDFAEDKIKKFEAGEISSEELNEALLENTADIHMRKL